MPTSIVGLGQLESVPLKEAWPDEARNFTPWLAEEENLAQLGEALGLSLELSSVEKQVGPFAADILAKDITSHQWVLIENQLTATDHRHLGQILTYAAGLDARTIIWVAESFREEHRAALDFLNNATKDDFKFFAVQVELFRIGLSSLAPRFSIVAKPNNWNRKTSLAKETSLNELTETQKVSLDFWGNLIGAASDRYPSLSERTPYKGSWQLFRVLRKANPKIVLNAAFTSQQRLRIEAYMEGPLAKAAYDLLEQKKDQIEEIFGQPLAWERLPEALASRIAFYMPGNQARMDKGQWAAQRDWLLTWGPRLDEAMRHFVIALDEDALQNEPET